MNGLADPVILLDEKREVVDANLAARELLGEEALGHNLVKSLKVSEIIKAVDKVLAGEQAMRDEIAILSPVPRT